MLPLWIIDLGSSATSTTRLQNLLTKLGDKQKPYWHYCYVGKEEVTDAESCRALIEKLVEDGRECYNTFIREGYKLSNFHIAILGDAHNRYLLRWLTLSEIIFHVSLPTTLTWEWI